MNTYYIILDALAMAGPLILSFDKRVAYYKNWPKVALAIIIVGIPFIIWDVLFTTNGVWGFNEHYLLGINIYNLPIEEVLFFFVVPFSCIFIYECCRYYLRNLNTIKIDILVFAVLFVFSLSTLLIGHQGWYALISSLVGIGVLILWLFQKGLRHVGITFLLSLIPFLLMNGALTGMFTEAPVVWYNASEMVNIRIITIPIQDIIYGMTLIFSSIFVFEKLKNKHD